MLEGIDQSLGRCYYNGEQKNEKWEQNLTRTLALSVTSFPILCLVSIFHSPVPHVRSPIPVARL